MHDRGRHVQQCAAAASAAAALALACLLPVGAAEREHEMVRDLAYGEVLFDFYQENHFDALVRLLAARERNEIQAHSADAELLLGGLYLSYGLHQRAGATFERVLAEHQEPAVRDRAWFFLAKVWRQRGYLNEAEAALERVGSALPESFESERRLLDAQLAMEQGRFAEARDLLEDWDARDDAWLAYARYNLGVALVRLGQSEAGAAVLDQVGRTPLDPQAGETAASMRDKANVALGYARLQAGEAAAAKPALQRVRLEGPYSTKALLGVGWADAALAEYRTALSPWLELKTRSLLDVAVQESLLAVPYAFAQLGADAQAAEHYVEAIGAFDAEIARVEGSIEAIRSGAFVDALLAEPVSASSGWYAELDTVPSSVESLYLHELLATHDFQEALKNSRDLGQLLRNLDEWRESLVAFDDILDTRERAYRERLPVIEASLERLDLDRMARRRLELEARRSSIERERDVVALGSAEQQRLWDELSGLEPDLARLGNDAEARTLRSKQRFLKGLLQWELEREYKARLWAQTSNLKRLDLELKQAQARRYNLDAAKEAWPDRFAALTARIDALAPRVDALRDAAENALARQRHFIEEIAVAELEARRERLAIYRVQARFSLAAIYDRAAAQPASASAPALTEARP